MKFKNLSRFVLVIALVLLFVGCGQSNPEDNALTEQETTQETMQETSTGSDSPIDGVNILRFTSLTEFLLAYNEAAEARLLGRRSDFDGDVNLAALESLYLPIGIPDNYRLFRILATPAEISFWYLPEEHLVSDDAIMGALSHQLNFSFGFTRWVWETGSPKESMMEQHRLTEEDLIDGIYYFDGRRRFQWASDSQRISMGIPLPTTDDGVLFTISDDARSFTTFNLDEPPSFTQIRTIDLTNPIEVEELLQEQIPTLHQLDFRWVRLNRYIEAFEPGEFDPIEILSNTNIIEFLLANHATFTVEGPTKEGYEFAGWYLNPAFETPLTEFTRMPARNTTLYAAWQPIDTPTTNVATFHPGTHGTFTNNDTGQPTITQQIPQGTHIIDVPQIQPNDGWQFTGWLQDNNGDVLSPEQVMALNITQDTTFTAQYTATTPPPSYHTVTFDAGLGNSFNPDNGFDPDFGLGGNPAYRMLLITVPHGDNIPWMEIPDPVSITPIDIFGSWFNHATGQNYAPHELGEIVVTSDMTFVAQFRGTGGWWRAEPAYQTE